MTLVYHTEFPPEPARAVKPEARPLPLGVADHIEPLMACKHCKGHGHTLSKGFTVDDRDSRRDYPSKWKPCYDCNGTGWFHAPDLKALALAIKGRKLGTLRSKRPDDARAYFVWRLARFHGGQDTCLPMGAEMEIGGDPYKEILDTLAQMIAERLFGSGNFGRARWQAAMHGSHTYADVPADIQNMPVHDGNKPLSEMLETV